MDVWSHGESNEMRLLRWMCGVTEKDKDAEVDVWSHGESNKMRLLRWMCGVTEKVMR